MSAIQRLSQFLINNLLRLRSPQFRKYVLFSSLNFALFSYLNGLWVFPLMAICLIVFGISKSIPTSRLHFGLGLFLAISPFFLKKLADADGLHISIWGLSFFTLNIVGYLLDVRWGRVQPESNIFVYFSFLTFFGNLSTGPILLFQEFKKQVTKDYVLKIDALAKSSLLIASGCFQKLVIFDGLSGFVHPVLETPNQFSGLETLVMIFLCKLYIFYGISSFSRIATGVSLLAGIRLPPNFNRPFASTNIKEFWSRWHMSVGHWIKNYVFLPSLRLNRYHRFGVYFSVFLSFLTFSLWHGISWNFLIYAILQSLFFLIYELNSGKSDEASGRERKVPFRALMFYLIVLAIPAVLFVAPNLSTVGATWENLIVSPFWPAEDIARDFFSNLGSLLFVMTTYEVSRHFLRGVDFPSLFLRQSFAANSLYAILYLLVLAAFSNLQRVPVFMYWRF